MKKGILIIALTLFFGLTSAFSQGHFSTDKSAFVGELSTYLNSSTSKQDREEAAVVMKGFGGVWNSYYSDSEANTIIGLCNLLHAKSGGKGYANIFNLVEVLQRIPTGGLTHSDVNNWLTFTNAKAHLRRQGVVGQRQLQVDRARCLVEFPFEGAFRVEHRWYLGLDVAKRRVATQEYQRRLLSG